MSRGDGILPLPLPRPLQLTGANALPVATRSAALENDQQRENVNQVQNQYYDNRNEYKEHEAAYVVFVSEPTDR